MSSSPEFARSSPLAREQVRGHRDHGPATGEWAARWAFGIVLAGIAIGATVWGGLPFVVFLSLGCTAAIREWHRLFTRQYLLPAMVTATAMIAALLWQLYPLPFLSSGQTAALFILLLGGACNLILGAARRQAPFANASAVMYIALPALTLLMIRQQADHPVWSVVLIFLAVWTTDTGALLAGKFIGGPKLAPSLSPKKTWAGSVGGLACAAIVASILAVLLHVRIVPAAVFALLLSLAGQTGDLFESMVKRRAGCKDSGGLIPGHGGVLDRIDSILFAAPVGAILIFLLGFNPAQGAHL